MRFNFFESITDARKTMNSAPLLGALLAGVSVLLAYNLGYRSGFQSGQSLGFDTGKKEGSREGARRGFAVGYDRGKRATVDEDDEEVDDDPEETVGASVPESFSWRLIGVLGLLGMSLYLWYRSLGE